MERVSSATAFVLRYLGAGAADPAAQRLIQDLNPLERQVLELLARVPRPEQRRKSLEQQTGEPWTPARYDRLELRALSRLQSALRQGNLLEP